MLDEEALPMTDVYIIAVDESEKLEELSEQREK
jgi:cell division protein FtsX